MHRDLLTTTATAALLAASSSGPRRRRTPSCPSSIVFAAILTLSGFAAAPAQAQAVAIDPTTFPQVELQPFRLQFSPGIPRTVWSLVPITDQAHSPSRPSAPLMLVIQAFKLASLRPTRFR